VAIAEGPLGESVRGELVVTRPLGVVVGGCSATGGQLVVLVALWMRRRKSG
jgi:acetyl esterase/lipase